MPTVPGSIQSKPKPRQFSATGIRIERTRIVSQSHQRPCNLSNQHERRNQSRLQEHCSTYTKMGSALDWRHMLQNYICYSNNCNLLHAYTKKEHNTLRATKRKAALFWSYNKDVPTESGLHRTLHLTRPRHGTLYFGVIHSFHLQKQRVMLYIQIALLNLFIQLDITIYN